jgi:hypothetical protein
LRIALFHVLSVAQSTIHPVPSIGLLQKEITNKTGEAIKIQRVTNFTTLTSFLEDTFKDSVRFSLLASSQGKYVYHCRETSISSILGTSLLSRD